MMKESELNEQQTQSLAMMRAIYADMPNAFSDDYVKDQVAWYNAPEHYCRDGVIVEHKPILGVMDDYLNRNFRIDESLVVPVFGINKQVWMSLTPMEIQSAALAIYIAAGAVATCGLGMGYVALAFAAKDTVASVDVYESRDDVIEYFTSNFSNRDGYDKINIIRGDARDTMRGKEYDFVYVDIYQTMLPDEVADDIALFTSENTIGDYWFWGLELVLLGALNNEQIGSYDLPDVMRMYFTEWSLTEGSSMVMPCPIDEEFAANVVNALSESGSSVVDLILD